MSQKIKIITLFLFFLIEAIISEQEIPDIENEDYYTLLNIPKDADLKAIKSAYRKLALRWHPDKNPDNQEQATNVFRALTEAYDCLSNEECRENYNRYGKEGMKAHQQRQNNGGGWNFDFGDIFNFGGFGTGKKQKFNMGGDFTFERAEEIFKRVFEDDINNNNSDDDNIFKGFGDSGFKFNTNFGNNNGGSRFQTFSSSQTFSTSRGGGGGSQTISTSTIIRDGKTVEVKKVSVTRPDGSVDTKVTETVIDSQGKRLTSEKQYQEGQEFLDADL